MINSAQLVRRWRARAGPLALKRENARMAERLAEDQSTAARRFKRAAQEQSS